jgi:methylmalonyl-CoA/ethylmalonyl-CoA epimerase
MQKIEHIGIAVANIDEAEARYEKLLNTKSYKREEVASENVITSFFKIGESKIELVASTNEDGTIAKYIEKKGEGMHHIAYAVEDISTEVERMISEGFQPISKEPKKGADNKMVFFFHPKSANGVLVELCQEIK